MLCFLKRNPLQCIPLHQITQTQLPFLSRNLISNGANFQTYTSPFTVFFYSSASSNPRKESPKITEPILDFFHSYGFTDTQMRKFIHKCPSVRSIEMIKPKLEYLLVFGFSPSELIKIICSDPYVLVSSLEKRMAPNLSLLEATFGSKTHIIKAVFRGGTWLLRTNFEKVLIPNVKILRENNIPMEKIALLFTRSHFILYKNPDVLTETITKLKELSIRPSSTAFICGITGLLGLKKETWERKMELYRSLGWSEEDTLSAFARQPMCMQVSEEKIKTHMQFFKEKLQWDSAMVLRWPVVLLYSLEKRLIPRCAVLCVLAKNGLWNGKLKVGVFTMAEKIFERRFVDKYEKEVPEVIDAYQGKVDFVGFESMEAESDKS